MQTYGATFRELRNSKMITLKDIEAQTGITSSFISRFERGRSDISISKLQTILTAVNISMEEFLEEQRRLSVNLDASHEDAGIFLEIARSPYMQPYLKFRTVNAARHQPILTELTRARTTYRQTPTRSNHFVYLFYQSMALASEDDINEHAAERMALGRPIVAYLQQVGTWNAYEYYLFELFAMTISQADNIRLLRLGLKRLAHGNFAPVYMGKAFDLLLADFTSAISYNLPELAQAVLSEMDKQKLENASEALTRSFCHGWYNIRFGDNQLGQRQCNDVITALRPLKVQPLERLSKIRDELRKNSKFNMIIINV